VVKTLLTGLGKGDEDDYGDPIGLTYKESSFFTIGSNNFKVDKESIITQKCPIVLYGKCSVLNRFLTLKGCSSPTRVR